MQANALHNIYHKYYQIIKVKKVMIYEWSPYYSPNWFVFTSKMLISVIIIQTCDGVNSLNNMKKNQAYIIKFRNNLVIFFF